jgi:four helix bundle protein
MSEELKKRTKTFALRCVDLALALPDTDLGRTIRRQLLRCGTGVGAGYRAAARAKSPPDFIAKMGTVEEETDECMFWMEIITEKALMGKDRVEGLHAEADEILSIVIASIKTARKNQ